eukprot:scaffold22701_cov123-Cylindrotheca_fusiformis.AAC.12
MSFQSPLRCFIEQIDSIQNRNDQKDSIVFRDSNGRIFKDRVADVNMKRMQKKGKGLLSKATIVERPSYAWSSCSMFHRIARTSVQQVNRRSTTLFMSSSSSKKPGVATPEELRDFVKSAGDKLLVIDTRNADSSVEPGDQKSFAVAPLPSAGVRPKAVNLVWDRESNSMPLPEVEKDTFIITHCGGGGRGQKAKEFLKENGFENVVNGAGPKETDCWAEFGDFCQNAMLPMKADETYFSQGTGLNFGREP